LDDSTVERTFDEFREEFVPGHMHKRFLKTFGVPKAAFGNRYFMEDATFRDWDTRLSSLLPADVATVEVEVIYGSPDALEGWRLKGETRRSLRDIVIDDWHGACAIIRAEGTTIYLFVEEKIRGVLIRIVKGDDEDA
jgi:hypothetical protein